MLSRRLVIAQEYLPDYRVTFFDRLVDRLARTGVRTLVVTGDAPTGARGDIAPLQPWQRSVRTRTLRAGGHTLRAGLPIRILRSADAVVLPMLGSSLDAYRLLTSRRRPAVGLWGHLRPYVATGHPVDLSLERWQARRADHLFAYTESGNDYARSLGVAPARITTLHNTIDTDALDEAVAHLDDSAVVRFQSANSLDPRRTFGVISALDSPKRIAFIAAVLDHLWAADPQVKVLVAGRGEDEGLLTGAWRRGQVIALGRVGADDKALIGACARALINPGRIGLVAVDALVLRLPVLTTTFPFHAPEAEYLQEGVSRHTLPDDPRSFAAELIRLSATPVRRLAATATPTVDGMVERFALGVEAMLSAGRISGRWPPEMLGRTRD